MPDTKDIDELAQRLYAAGLSFHMGNKTIDYTRRTYVPPETKLGKPWVTLAEQVLGLIEEANTLTIPSE